MLVYFLDTHRNLQLCTQHVKVLVGLSLRIANAICCDFSTTSPPCRVCTKLMYPSGTRPFISSTLGSFTSFCRTRLCIRWLQQPVLRNGLVLMQAKNPSKQDLPSGNLEQTQCAHLPCVWGFGATLHRITHETL